MLVLLKPWPLTFALLLLYRIYLEDLLETRHSYHPTCYCLSSLKLWCLSWPFMVHPQLATEGFLWMSCRHVNLDKSRAGTHYQLALPLLCILMNNTAIYLASQARAKALRWSSSPHTLYLQWGNQGLSVYLLYVPCSPSSHCNPGTLFISTSIVNILYYPFLCV